LRWLTNIAAGWQFDPSFTEHDEQWNAVYKEQAAQQALRTRLLLNEIFAEDPSTFISITAHSGTLSGFFAAVGHQEFPVKTGQFVPVLVRPRWRWFAAVTMQLTRIGQGGVISLGHDGSDRRRTICNGSCLSTDRQIRGLDIYGMHLDVHTDNALVVLTIVTSLLNVSTLFLITVIRVATYCSPPSPLFTLSL
jgi:hypothetical protein